MSFTQTHKNLGLVFMPLSFLRYEAELWVSEVQGAVPAIWRPGGVYHWSAASLDGRLPTTPPLGGASRFPEHTGAWMVSTVIHSLCLHLQSSLFHRSGSTLLGLQSKGGVHLHPPPLAVFSVDRSWMQENHRLLAALKPAESGC